MEFKIQIGVQTLNVLPPLWGKDNTETAKIWESQFETMSAFRDFVKNLKRPDGKPAAAGMAAPQCGINHRYCVVNNGSDWILAINPSIIAVDEDEESYESCLSWPGRIIKTRRYKNIKVDYYCFDSKTRKNEEFTGFTAKVWQHEIDHLDGVEEKLLPVDFKTVRNEGPKIGRNDPCPCGSGKKYKKCCGG